jgi:hypothetical protein
MNYIKQNHLSLLIILWLVLSGIFGSSLPVNFGAAVNETTTISNKWVFNPGTLKLGSTGSALSLVKSGTCVLTSNTSIAATTTGQATCATTGSKAGDIVYLNLATTTTTLSKQFLLLPNTVATTDSTTVTIVNLTGAVGVPAAVPTLGSTTQYQIFR